MTDEQVAEIVAALESLKMRFDALESAVLHIQGFYKETRDGSTEGQVKFGTPPEQVPPVTTSETTTTGAK